MRITVFTPTYNRAYIIKNLFDSLIRQSFTDFEWIVIDDGSTDETETLCAEFMRSATPFPIIYKKVPNGGKHRAINVGVQLARGELFFIVDSDDYLTDDALEGVDIIEKTIPLEERRRFAGVCGMKGYSLDQPIGTTFSGTTLDISALERKKNNISGDKSEVFYTEILKKYPFPEFCGENFLTECVVWDKIAADGYLLRFYNKISMVCNYLPDGLTARYSQLMLKNPQGYGLYLYQSVQYKKLQGLEKWEAIKKYYNALRNKETLFQIAKYLHMNPVRLWLRLFGMRLYKKIYDQWG
ncbi:MAG: glycosyltransferase family 2 protein [Oscillospiraceae bacterium]|nr:glycosyltransferase family 2 protein [Oscillospiraceae bacterium]